MKYFFRFLKLPLALHIGLAVAVPLTLPAAVLTFQNGSAGYVGTRDTELRSAMATTPQGTNLTVLVSSNLLGGPVHGLLKFENIVGSATNQIPLGATVESVSLTLRTASSATLTNTVRLHRMLAPWDQNSSTWNSLSNGVSTDNTEALANPDATFIPQAMNSLSNTALVATVQTWVNGPSTYQGWAFLPSGPDYSFHSSEALVMSNRPSLLVNFTPSALSITDQPRSQVVCAEGSANFCVTASGTAPLSYQWRHDGLTVSGATTNNCLSLINVQPSQAGAYTAVVTNAGGFVVSSNAVLTVLATGPPVIVCPSNLVVFAPPE